MINKLIKPSIEQEFLYQLFAETIDLEPGSRVMNPEESIFSALGKGLVEIGLVDDVLTGSACLFIFFDKLNTALQLDIPDELINSTLTFGSLLLEVNRMIEANNLLRVRFDSLTLAIILQELESITLPLDIFSGDVRKFLRAVTSLGNAHDDDSDTLTCTLDTTLFSLGLDLTEEERHHLDTCTSMIEACRFIDSLLSSRKQNDCWVKYGKSWSRTIQQQTRESLLQFGKYPAGMPMKHIVDHTLGIIDTPTSTTNGIAIPDISLILKRCCACPALS